MPPGAPLSRESSSDPPSGAEGSAPSSRARWWKGANLVLIVLIAGFLLTIWQRDRLRARWWAYQLTQTPDPAGQARLLTNLLAVGDAAHGAIRSLAHHPSSDVRSMAVVLLSRSADSIRIDGLAGLLDDADADVRESAAFALAFTRHPDAARRLAGSLADGTRPRAAAAAAAGLARLPVTIAASPLCDAILNHADPLVRAQAVESAFQFLDALRLDRRGGLPVISEAPRLDHRQEDRLINACAAALFDEGRFDGLLALERSIAGAAAFAAAVTDAAPSPRNLAGGDGVRAGRSVSGVGRSWLARLAPAGAQLDPSQATPEDASARIRALLRATATTSTSEPATRPGT